MNSPSILIANATSIAPLCAIVHAFAVRGPGKAGTDRGLLHVLK
ncbi:MAG TPA: hypothetical protein VN760_03470 [Casimicrobiaceae bacterium]|nr:hypothetical protein [Casimicrobiaceae bacterium]